MKTTPYYERRKHEHGVTDADVRATLAAEAHRQIQPDGRIRVWGYAPGVGKYLRVILLPDGKTVHNAFPDRGFDPGAQP